MFIFFNTSFYSQSYYRHSNDMTCSILSAERGLMVNCTGCCLLPRPFETHNRSGRKDYYLLYMCRGKMNVLSSEGLKTMHAGQFITFYPEREYRYAGAGNTEIVYFWVHFTGSDTGKILKDFGMADRRIFDAGVSDDVIRKFGLLFSEFIRKDEYFESASASLLASILVSLVRLSSKKPAGSAPNPSEKIFASLMYIHRNYYKEILLEELAGIEHLSPSRYRAVFRKYAGLSPMEYIISLRIKRACELIRHSDLAIKEIAESVGWHDQLYFSRIFKNKTGYPPTAYRNIPDVL